ncbi:MAG: activase [Chitinivibrionales bacterium]|nr:activase [Chitinivibrionales bacterium]
MKTLGICFGATTVQIVGLVIDKNRILIELSRRIAHQGDPHGVTSKYLKGENIHHYDAVAVTGRNLRSQITLSKISEPVAMEYALKEVYADKQVPEYVISLGGETHMAYRIGEKGDILSVNSGTKCASGTGEFFLQQIRRMDLNIDEAVSLAQRGEPHKIAGRCAVFCKSDVTHALNKGEPKENVAAGLCSMIADKIGELTKDSAPSSIALVGGGSKNTAVVKILKQRYPLVDIPAQADVFEAFGAAIWAMHNECKPIHSNRRVFSNNKEGSFGFHPPLSNALSLVDYKEQNHGTPREGDVYILGLDVGSTTTKAVLIRAEDKMIISSVYLRTNSDPTGASRRCYEAIARDLGAIDVTIIGLGVTGSGRQIAGLHALTDNITNEIIAHATAAAWFDSDVDTIFEIGGQDAKYTYLTNGVPSNYAMNEACSAGTGSFLEEAAIESLGVDTKDIADHAFASRRPPNFSDQCAAFISSDIKRAVMEGLRGDDIIAGLVYSICCNYLNKVKGSRPMGRKIFMQGGVCYNQAVPAAMASLIRTRIVVPPDPGLMGAFGAALEVARRLDSGQCSPAPFDLGQLAQRTATREGVFTCGGGKERCDRKCTIAKIRIEGRRYPFGGICDKYYNQRMNKNVDTAFLDLVAKRHHMLIEAANSACASAEHYNRHARKSVGISNSFLTHSLLPLYARFFSELGFSIVLSDEIDSRGLSRTQASFCLPAELAHGSFYHLLKRNPDYIFLPHIMLMPVNTKSAQGRVCFIAQGEPYYLKSTFRREIEASRSRIISPVVQMESSYQDGESGFVTAAREMGVGARRARAAFTKACAYQETFEQRLRQEGKKALAFLDDHPETFGIALFGRSYNAYAGDANMGIPHKIASRGHMVIPLDMLPIDNYPVHTKDYWALGQKIMKGARFVAERKNLYACYITNFSCGPDSFLLTWFGEIMGQKPSLALELDQHTADAGIDTRIDAAIDIINHYRTSEPEVQISESTFRRAQMVPGKMKVVACDGHIYPVTHPRVEVVIPPMGEWYAQGLVSVLRGRGIRARALPVPDEQTLMEGRKNASCKECFPFILLAGAYSRFLREAPRDPGTISLLSVATGGGPCRLGQYARGLELLIKRWRIPDAAVLTISDEDGFSGLGYGVLLRSWQVIVVSDVFSDIRSLLNVAAVDPAAANKVLDSSWNRILEFFERKYHGSFVALLRQISERLRRIPLRCDPDDIPVVTLTGEIFVRREEFSRKNILEYFETNGIMVKVAPMSECLLYSNFVIQNKLCEKQPTFPARMSAGLVGGVQQFWDRTIRSQLARSGLCRKGTLDIKATIHGVKHLINPQFHGEHALTVGLSMHEIRNGSCGVVAIGPFGCMQTRIAESILKNEMNTAGRTRSTGGNGRAAVSGGSDILPFMAIETDGNRFPQSVEANLEAFVMRVKAIHRSLRKGQGKNRQGKKYRSRADGVIDAVVVSKKDECTDTQRDIAENLLKKKREDQ